MIYHDPNSDPNDTCVPGAFAECRKAVLGAVEGFGMHAHALHVGTGYEAHESELQRLKALVRTKLDEADLWWGRVEALLRSTGGRERDDARTRAHARVLEGMSAAELSAAGLCMFGLHQRDLSDGWPRATHRVLFADAHAPIEELAERGVAIDPALLKGTLADEIRCCEQCARIYSERVGATVSPLAAAETPR